VTEKLIAPGELRSASIDPEYFYAAISHASTRVRSLSWDVHREGFRVTFDGSSQELENLIESVRTKIGSPLARHRGRVLYEHHGHVEPQPPVWEQLVRSGAVWDLGGGHVAYTGLFLELVEAFDAIFRGAAARLRAHAVQLPAFIPLRIAARLNAFEHYPHHLFFVTPLVSDHSMTEAFQKTGTPDAEQLERCAYCLKMSACSLLYPMLEGADLPGVRHYTMLGSCSRNESKTASTFERLVEFQMREIVCAGDEDDVSVFEEYSIQLFRDLIEALRLKASIATATDSFFLSDYGKYRISQLIRNDKLELPCGYPN